MTDEHTKTIMVAPKRKEVRGRRRHSSRWHQRRRGTEVELEEDEAEEKDHVLPCVYLVHGE